MNCLIDEPSKIGKLKLFFILILLPIFLISQDDPQERIIKRVQVVNVETLARVFHKGKPVSGLQKKDFSLWVDGKLTPIHGFSEFKKKIKVKTKLESISPENQPSSRLFMLIFFISDYTLKMSEGIDLFFEKIFRPGDRLIVLSNNYFIDDRRIMDLGKEKEKIKQILKIEATKFRQFHARIRMRMHSFLYSFADDLMNAVSDNRGALIRSYRDMYFRYLQEFKEAYLNLDNAHFQQMADYIKKQHLDTWVFNFYQLGGFYVPRTNSKLASYLGSSLVNSMVGGEAGDDPRIFHELWVADKLNEHKLANLFINTGATVQSVYLRAVTHPAITWDYNDPILKINSLNWRFEYKVIATAAENTFSRMSQLTGGGEIRSNKLDRFVDKVMEVEDIFYSLTFVPGAVNTGRHRIKIRHKNPKYKIIYNNQKLPYTFENIPPPEKRLPKPQINFKKVNIDKGELFLWISGFKQVKESASSKVSVRVHIKFLNKKAVIVYNKYRNFNIASELKRYIRFKSHFLAKGKYLMVVEVKDLSTGSNDLIIYDVMMDKTGIMKAAAKPTILSADQNF